MAEKTLKTRIVHKHETEADWSQATGFTPKEAELIVYDKDDTHAVPRVKIGDGETNVNDLPFVSLGGIYVGEGAMPDGYDIQINPNGVVDTGANGKSAYEIAQDAGFEGTEAEWLTSIQGSDAYKPWTLIDTVTLENNVIEIRKDFPTNTYKEVFIEAVLPIISSSTTAKSTQFNVMRSGNRITAMNISVKNGDTVYLRAKGWITPGKRQVYDVWAAIYKYIGGTVYRNPNDVSTLGFNYLDHIIITANGSVTFAAGGTVKYWGR